MTVNEIITNRIIEGLHGGKIPWEKPWYGGYTMNAINKIPYSGINAIITRYNPYDSPYYLTAKQCIKIGAHWQGHGTPILYWNFITKEIVKDTGEIEEKHIGFMKYYLVWSVEQIELPEGFKLPEKPENTVNPIIDGEKYLAQFPIKYRIQDKAYYSPSSDEIVLPERNQFRDTSAFYETAFHECAHCTGHKSRLNRNMTGFYGNHEYAYEELVADIASAFTLNHLGILSDTEKNTIAYCQSWIKILGNNPSWIIKAAGQADKAYKWIIGENATSEEIAA